MFRIDQLPAVQANHTWKFFRAGGFNQVALASGADSSIPHLRPQGSAAQLVVDGKPFLIRGGEIGNSTGTNPAYVVFTENPSLAPVPIKFATPPFFAVLAHGMAAVSFWRTGSLLKQFRRRIVIRMSPRVKAGLMD